MQEYDVKMNIAKRKHKFTIRMWGLNDILWSAGEIQYMNCHYKHEIETSLYSFMSPGARKCSS